MSCSLLLGASGMVYFAWLGMTGEDILPGLQVALISHSPFLVFHSSFSFHSLGVMPVMVLKARKNEDSAAKPDCIHTSVIFISGRRRRSCLAWAMR